MCRVNAVYSASVFFWSARDTSIKQTPCNICGAREDRTIMSCNKQHFPACWDLIRINTRNNRSLFRRASNSWVHELFKQYWFIDQHCMQNARWGFGSSRTGFGMYERARCRSLNFSARARFFGRATHLLKYQGKRLLICQSEWKGSRLSGGTNLLPTCRNEMCVLTFPFRIWQRCSNKRRKRRSQNGQTSQ